MEILVGCISVKEVELPCLPSEIVVDKSTGLDPDTDYVTIIEDRHGNKDRQELTTDSEGNLTIAVNDPHAFTPAAGIFSLEIYTPDEEPVTLDLCGDTFSVINLRFVHFTGDEPDPVISCNEPTP